MLEILNQYRNNGLISVQKHPKHDLYIWNYTPKVQYDNLWDDITLICRGLITDKNGKIIVQPFKKFFNYEQVIDDIPLNSDYVYIQEKMDGSLGILFQYMNEWIMATRGSFTSIQAIRGFEIINKMYNLRSFEPSVSYLVEIIYPENKIVVNYKEEKVVFLSATLNHSFTWNETKENELHWTTACTFFNANGIKKEDIVETQQYFTFGHDLIKNLQDKNEKNKEGFVFRFFPSNFRIKIKFEEYIRLHRLVTNISNRNIWEYLKNNKPLNDIIENVPDEFYNWVKETETNLKNEYKNIELECLINFELIKRLDTRKLFAQESKNFRYPSILFKMLDNQDYSEMIWKIIYPNYSKPFLKSNDE